MLLTLSCGTDVPVSPFIMFSVVDSQPKPEYTLPLSVFAMISAAVFFGRVISTSPLTVLKYNTLYWGPYKPYARLLPHKKGGLIKSGTLKGVYSYTGYFVRQNRCDSFVIILNQNKNTRDKILDVIESKFDSAPG